MGIPRWVIFVGGLVLFLTIWSNNRPERKTSTMDRVRELVDKAKTAADRATEDKAGQSSNAKTDQPAAVDAKLEEKPTAPAGAAVGTAPPAQPVRHSLGHAGGPV